MVCRSLPPKRCYVESHSWYVGIIITIIMIIYIYEYKAYSLLCIYVTIELYINIINVYIYIYIYNIGIYIYIYHLQNICANRFRFWTPILRSSKWVLRFAETSSRGSVPWRLQPQNLRLRMIMTYYGFFLDLDMQDLGWWIVYGFNRFQTVSIGFNMILYDINDITWTSWSTQASKLPLVPSCGTMSRWSLSDMSQKPDVDLDLWVFPKQFPTDLPHSQDDTHSIVLACSGNFTDLFISFLGSVKWYNHSDTTHDKLVDSSRR